MYERMIRYKAIFMQGDQKETVEYKEKGVFFNGERKKISFRVQEKTIEITYDEKRISLKHGDSLLKMHRDKEMWNEYLLPYGSVRLKTRVLMYEASHEALKLKYELSDDRGVLSTAYVLITMV